MKHNQTNFFKDWLHTQLESSQASFAKIRRHKLSSFFTVLLIGVVLSLPTILFVMLDNITIMDDKWAQTSHLSAYLNSQADMEHIDTLIQRLQAKKEIKAIQFISKDQSLDEFKKNTDLSKALDLLPQNPLPAVLIIEPKQAFQTPQALDTLKAELVADPLIDTIQMDSAWLNRLYSIVTIIKRLSLFVCTILGAAVLLSISNTLRLVMQKYHKEISLMQLIGATNSYIRRPFLHTGLYYGLFGGVIAWLIVNILLVILHKPINQLIESYHTQMHFSNLSFVGSLSLLALSATLGLIGAFISVNYHIRHPN